MDLKLARQAELFTIAEKDDRYCKAWIEDDLQEIAQRCLGVRKWVQFRSAITVLSRFGYFAISSLENIPTPGEEFCEAQTRNSSLMQRIMTAILSNDFQLPKEIPRPIVNLIKDVHMITFFFFSDFYQLSTRLTGINYVTPSVDTSTGGSRWEVMNKLIGCIAIFKMILNLPKQAELSEQTHQTQSTPTLRSSVSVGEIHPDVVCQLCTSVRQAPTSALCGHIFCWNCIHNWLKERNECPICRMPTEPSRLIHLINFR